VFKFIIESRLLFSRATGGQYEEGFQRDLFAVFNALNSMLSVSYDIILDTQVTFKSGWVTLNRDYQLSLAGGL
jgi:hypothetical protein